VPPTQVFVVSDSHLSAATPEAPANWEGVLAHVTDAAPDIVLHRGDRTLGLTLGGE
jgi:hypothetical protein